MPHLPLLGLMSMLSACTEVPSRSVTADTGGAPGDSAFLPPGDGGWGGPGRFPGGDGGFGGGFPGGTRDRDGDGFSGRLDCDDSDASVYPGAPERCNGVDDDCDGTSELIGWWSFEEGSGSLAADSGPLGLDGTLVGSGWTSSGHDGGGLRNSSDQYVELDYAELELTEGITITAWARPTALAGYNAVVARGVSSGVYNPYHLGYKDGSPLWATDDGSLGPHLQDLSDPGGHVGAWHHLAGTWDPGTGARALYVDGVEAASDTDGPSTLTYDSEPTRFGADTNDGSIS